MRKCRAVADRRVLPVDDVLPPSATARACALVRKRAGAKSVALSALARVDRRLVGPAAQVGEGVA